MAGVKLAEPSMASVPDAQENDGTAGFVGIVTGVGLGIGDGCAVVAVAVAAPGDGEMLARGVGVFAPAAGVVKPTWVVVATGEMCCTPPDGPGNRKEVSSAPSSPINSKITTRIGSSFLRHSLAPLVSLPAFPALTGGGTPSGDSFFVSGTASPAAT